MWECDKPRPPKTATNQLGSVGKNWGTKTKT